MMKQPAQLKEKESKQTILEPEEDFNKEFKDKEIKIKNEIEELPRKKIPSPKCKKAFHGKSWPGWLVSILKNISFTAMDKLEKEETMEKRPLKKKTWYDGYLNIFQTP